MENNEKVLFSNAFGTVTDKRVILNYKSGTEDIPVTQITSVSYQHRRNYLFSIFSAIIGLGTIALILSAGRLGSAEVLVFLFIIVVAFLSGVANWIGNHVIIISTGGNNRKPLKVEMSKTKEGRDFTNAIKQVVIK
jgi:hypothetical protein